MISAGQAEKTVAVFWNRALDRGVLPAAALQAWNGATARQRRQWQVNAAGAIRTAEIAAGDVPVDAMLDAMGLSEYVGFRQRSTA